MIFRRQQKMKNLIDDEEPDRKDYKPEIFENVKRFVLRLDDYEIPLDEKFNNISEIIESDNYFTLVSKDRKTIQCIRYDRVLGYDLYIN